MLGPDLLMALYLASEKHENQRVIGDTAVREIRRLLSDDRSLITCPHKQVPWNSYPEETYALMGDNPALWREEEP